MTAHTVARKDTLPEGTRYEDTGCHLFPSCLNCPRAACIYDLPEPSSVAERDERVLAEFVPHNEAATRELAQRYGISTRTVYRIVERGGPSAQARRVAGQWESLTSDAKPVSEIRSPWRARTPWPRLPVGARV